MGCSKDAKGIFESEAILPGYPPQLQLRILNCHIIVALLLSLLLLCS